MSHPDPECLLSPIPAQICTNPSYRRALNIEGLLIVDACTTRYLPSPASMALTSKRHTLSPAKTTTEAMTLRHCDFDLTISTMHGRFGAQSYGYTVLHRGHVLHQSGGEFGTASAADKAARRLIDDALGVFDNALAHFDEK